MIAPLQVISAYSLLQSPLSISEYITRGEELHYQALGLADVNVLYGALAFYRECVRKQIKPLIGLTIDFSVYDSLLNNHKLIIYAKNYAGYQSLMQISTYLQCESHVKVTDIESILFTNGENLIVIFEANNGPHMAGIKTNDFEQAAQIVHHYRSHLPQDHLYIGLNAQSRAYYHLEAINNLSKKLQVPLIATPEISYLYPDDMLAEIILKAINRNETVDDFETVLSQKGVQYLESPDEVKRKYTQLHQEEALEQLEKVVQMMDLEMPKQETLLPEFPLPDDVNSAGEYLKNLAFSGLSSQIKQPTTEYTQRLTYELQVIHEMGYDDYFLIVWDVLAYARKQHIMLGAGRGSAAGSLVAFSLGITGVDPIKNDLLFERFLNPERQNMPDIDLDFPDNRRQDILNYVYHKYGQDHVAQIATFGTFAARKAIRDVGSALGKSQETLSQWANTIPKTGNNSLESVFKASDRLRTLIHQETQGELWFKLAKRIEGLPRHVSTHAAGVIISKSPLRDHLPLQQGNHGIWNSQFTMNDVESLGLLKMDFLSLINLTILQKATQSASRLAGKSLNPKAFDQNDDQVYALFRRAETFGVFQFESEGIRQVLRRVQPTSMDDIAAVNALYRPGPMQQIDHFVKRKHGQEPITYPHPDLEPILAPTYGIMVYQEQVMQVTQKIAGFTLGQADLLRRAMSKKKLAIMSEMKGQFIEGAKSKGYTEDTAVTIYNYIEAFANYGFNKSHAYAYSYLAYQLAWLKVHYPTAFYYGNLEVVNTFDKKGSQLLAEAKQKDVLINIPDINQSYVNLQVVNEQTLQLGLQNIKGLPKQVAKEIVQGRQMNGKYKDLFQFVNRLPKTVIKEEHLIRLAKSGAFDGMAFNRRTIIEEAIPKLLAHVQLFGQNNTQQTQLSFDAELENDELFMPQISPCREYSDRELMTGEIETLGQAFSVNIYERYTIFFRKGLLTPIERLKSGDKAWIIGEIVDFKRIRTKKGDPMAFATLEDETGAISLTLFPQTYIDEASRVHMQAQLCCYGRVEMRNGQLQMIVQKTQLLNKELYSHLLQKISHSPFRTALKIKVTDRETASKSKTELVHIIKKNPGKVRLHFTLEQEKEKYWLADKFNVQLNAEMLSELANLYGQANIKLE